jgi:DNA-binding LacI/PurR family transcriptional regulator
MAAPNEITIVDVARAADVSVSTVSRILNGKQDVAPATRERVQQVIEELGYTPHMQAQSLRAGKTRNIALLFPHKQPGNLPYNALELDFILGATAGASENRYFFSMLTSQVSKSGLLGLYRSAQVDGLVLMHIHTQDWRVDLLRDSGYPFVMIGHCADNAGLSFIDLDFEASVVAAFDHLVELGHRRIGFLTLPAEMRQQGYGPSVRAWAGYEKALRTYGLFPLYREVSYVGEEIFRATLEILDEQPDVTAIVTTHEFASQNIVQGLQTRGREIPGDCSLVAFMTQKIAALSALPITYIDFPSYSMGLQAVEMLVRVLEGESDEPEQILIPPQLVLRRSTAPVR